MATNRTKIDWAYKQAVKIEQSVADMVWQTPRENIKTERAANVRHIAAMLRRAEKRGRIAEGRESQADPAALDLDALIGRL